jgi:hypothetical protein
MTQGVKPACSSSYRWSPPLCLAPVHLRWRIRASTGRGTFCLSLKQVNVALHFAMTSPASMLLSSLQQRLPTICLAMWTLTVTSGSAFTAPQNVRLAVVDCTTSPAQVSGRECCQHTDAREAGRRSDIEGQKHRRRFRPLFRRASFSALCRS